MQLIKKQLVSTGNKLNKYQLIPTEFKYECDQLIEQLGDLTNEGFRKWYCKVFYMLGRDNVLRLAATARQEGKNPRNYFSVLLKREYRIFKGLEKDAIREAESRS